MSRKGDLFMLGLNILFLIGVIFVFWKLSVEFRQPNVYEGIGTRQVALLNTYAVSEQMLLYIDSAAKFAAYEAIKTLTAKGSLNPVGSPCGSYASYELWSTPTETCFQERSEIDAAFAKELVRLLRTNLAAYPGMPDIALYNFDVSKETGILRIRGMTKDRITLPIVAAKNSLQSEVTPLLLEKRAAAIDHAILNPDSKLAAAVVSSPNFRPRAGGVTHLYVRRSGHDHAVDAFAEYRDGSTSTHYLVDQDGRITQVVQESAQAEFCDECPVPEESSIVIEIIGTLMPEAAATLAAEIVERVGIDYENIILGKELGDSSGFRIAVRKEAADLATRVPEEEPKASMLDLKVAWPADGTTVTSCWGDRSYHGDGFHDGIDIGGSGQPVYAFADGIVLSLCDASESSCGSFGSNVVLQHDQGISTRYSHLATVGRFRANQEIQRGDRIGTIGNTGNSEGAHLDFKVYTSSDRGANKGVNPLCLFPEEQLAQLTTTGQNCAKYRTRISHTDPTLAKECAGLTAFSTDKGCFDRSLSIETSDEKVQNTLENIEKQPGVADAILRGAADQNIEPQLVIAIIAQETCISPRHCGTANLVSPTGCAGLGQFCGPTARSPPYNSIFGPGVVTCSCPGRGACTAEEARCVSDPRFDATKSATAIALHLRTDMKYFAGMRDATRFAIASYNGGAGTIRRAIARTGKSDPSWEEVAARLDGSLIAQVCSETGDLCFFKTTNDRNKKADEIKTYVERVSGYYASQGGTFESTYDDRICPETQVTVRDLGTYEFSPGFTVEMPDLLDPLGSLFAWARETIELCTGDGDNRDCLKEREAAFTHPSLDIVSCSDVEHHGLVVTQYRQAVADCSMNLQDDCICPFNPIRPFKELEMQLHGPTARVLLDGAAVNEIPPEQPFVMFAEKPDDDPESVSLTLEVNDGRQRMATWRGPSTNGVDVAFYEETESFDVERDAFLGMLPDADVFMFGMYKDGKEVIWVADPDDAPLCGVYKTYHHVCAAFKDATYSVSEKKTVTPVVKFALHLRDEHPPEPVENGKAVSLASALDAVNPVAGQIAGALGSPVLVTFDPSSSEDVSYYLVGCSGISELQEPEKLLARKYGASGIDAKIDDSFSVELLCIGGTGSAQVTITPFDISGNEGDAISVPVERVESALDALG